MANLLGYLISLGDHEPMLVTITTLVLVGTLALIFSGDGKDTWPKTGGPR